MSDHPASTNDVLDRVTTPRGELVLRRVGSDLEVISNGVFLMDTRDGRSERALVSEAMALHSNARSVLIGGLGLGFSLIEAVEAPRLRRIVVVEVEPRIVDWHAVHLMERTGAAMRDPRVEIVVTDLASHLAASLGGYDVLCLDVDNGPDWTVTEDNAALYGEEGLTLMRQALRPGGVLGVWSARPAPAYLDLLQQHLDDVRVIEVPVRLARAEPDVVYLGRRV